MIVIRLRAYVLLLVESNFPNTQLLLFVFAMQTSLNLLSQAQTFLRISQFACGPGRYVYVVLIALQTSPHR